MPGFGQHPHYEYKADCRGIKNEKAARLWPCALERSKDAPLGPFGRSGGIRNAQQGQRGGKAHPTLLGMAYMVPNAYKRGPLDRGALAVSVLDRTRPKTV